MAWLTGWSYRKAITLSRASGAVTNYQMKLLVGETAGATGEDVDCNGHVQTDFDDLRFTTADGTTLLDYWIESITGTTPNQLATVWIEFDSIGTDATTFYMYYGNAEASAYSNGDNTFLAFDNFEDDTVGVIPSGWTEAENPTNGSTLTIVGGFSGKGVESIATAVTYRGSRGSLSPGAQYCVEARVKYIGNSEFILYSAGGYRCAVRRSATPTTFQYLTNDSPYWFNAITENANWHKIKIFVYDTNKVDYWIDSNSYLAKNIYGSSQAMDEYGCRFQETGTIDVDEIFVRNYRATEPTWGTWGGEEAGISGTASISGGGSLIASGKKSAFGSASILGGGSLICIGLAVGAGAYEYEFSKLGYINNPYWTEEPATEEKHTPCGFWFRRIKED